MSKDLKITDTTPIPGSRADRYWNARGFKDIYKQLRPGIKLPSQLQQTDNSFQVEKKYGFTGLQFGNWCTNEDRYNYLSALYIACFDLQKIVKAHNGMVGFNSLAVSFGARGVSAAVAHYEPHERVINITRYKSGTGGTKTEAFLSSGGLGAFAHEYGHFLDYYLGTYYEPSKSSLALSGGRSTDRKRREYAPQHTMRQIVEDILQIAYWKQGVKQLQPSDYMKRILNVSDRPYYRQRNEIFARLFEQYVAYRLRKSGIYNKFLSETKYVTTIYMTDTELRKVAPLFDKLMKEIARVR